MQDKPMILIQGKGSDLSNSKSIQRRARCKIINQSIILRLIDVAKERKAADRMKAYWNTYHCQNRVFTVGSKLHTNYCKNRYCTICCGMRKAELINKYLPTLKEWEEPFFVTLTVKAVPAYVLARRIKEMNETFKKINARFRKRCQRRGNHKLMGLKTIECNFNPEKKTYNPHLHLIVNSRESAENLVNQWLESWTPKFTHRDAQHFRKVKNPETDLIELIKYETKIFTDPEPQQKKQKDRHVKIYARALDNIYAAMKGVRIIDRFGFNLPKGTTNRKSSAVLVNDYLKWEYHPGSMDWLQDEHECPLTAYSPTPKLLELLENIDISLE